MSTQVNRYASIDLYLPSDLHDRVSLLVMTGSGGPGAPFDRQIDLWWTSILIGIALGQRSPNQPNLTKFANGTMLDSDPWRIAHLELLALAEEGKDVLETPKKVIQIASEYANTGVRWLTDRLLSEYDPIVKLVNIINELQTSETD